MGHLFSRAGRGGEKEGELGRGVSPPRDAGPRKNGGAPSARGACRNGTWRFRCRVSRMSGPSAGSSLARG